MRDVTGRRRWKCRGREGEGGRDTAGSSWAPEGRGGETRRRRRITSKIRKKSTSRIRSTSTRRGEEGASRLERFDGALPALVFDVGELEVGVFEAGGGVEGE